MDSYIRQQSAWEILKGSFSIYGRYFFALFFMYFLIVLPFAALAEIGAAENSSALIWIGSLLLYLAVTSIAGGALTVSVSDICLGNQPSIQRSYKRVFGVLLGKLLATDFLVFLFFIAGLILLVLPGLIFLAWVVVFGPVVVLEGAWGLDAIRRSKALGQGFYLRNGAMFAALIVVYTLIDVGLRLMGAGIANSLGFLQSWMVEAALVPFSELFSPILLIVPILMYYDLRARKEMYNRAALAEDLRH